MHKQDVFYNEDCIRGCERHLADESVDLIITDPPYGIQGDQLHRHYNRKEEYVLDGYVEIPLAEYGEFSRKWIAQAERILKPGGGIYIVSGYTNLYSILAALRDTELQEQNHIIWKYNFGVFTTKKFVSSHYHILYYVKPGARHTFNTHCRYGPRERDPQGGSLNYQDREDVWIINREYKPGQTKNKNALPTELLAKMILYSSNPGDVICDLFLGSFSTARVAIQLGRYATGFERSKTAYQYQMKQMKSVVRGEMLDSLRKPDMNGLPNRGKRWSWEEKRRLHNRFNELSNQDLLKKEILERLVEEFGRGRFAIERILRQTR